MGRRSPSPRRRSRSRDKKSDRKRSRSRDRHGKNSSSRRDRSRDRKEEKKDKSNAQGVLDAKKAMRDSLNAAAASIAAAVNNAPPPAHITLDDDEAPTSSMSRARAIAELDSDGFRQRQFKSSGGGAGGRVYGHQDNRKKVEKLEEAHESIIFGPTGRPQVQVKKEDPSDLIDLALNEEKKTIFPDVCYEDPTVRQERWLKIYNERRARLTIH